MAKTFPKRTTSMTDKFRAVARRSYLDMGMPRVGREVGAVPDTQGGRRCLYRVREVPGRQFQSGVR